MQIFLIVTKRDSVMVITEFECYNTRKRNSMPSTHAENAYGNEHSIQFAITTFGMHFSPCVEMLILA